MKPSIESQANSTIATLLVLMATRDVAHKCENVNYSFYTEMINATVVHNEYFQN